MKMPKSVLFVAGLSIVLFIITVIVISITAQHETVSKQEKTKPPILLEYKPSDKIYLTLRGYNRNESPEEQIVVMTYSINNGFTDRELPYTRWINLEDYYNNRKVEIINNKLTLRSYIYLDNYSVPFLADEFYAEKGALVHRANIIFESKSISTKTLNEYKEKILKYKNNGDKETSDNMLVIPDNLLALAVCGDREAAKLLKDRDAYNKYFNVKLDGHTAESYSMTAGVYEIFEYLQHQGGSMEEVIRLDK